MTISWCAMQETTEEALTELFVEKPEGICKAWLLERFLYVMLNLTLHPF